MRSRLSLALLMLSGAVVGCGTQVGVPKAPSCGDGLMEGAEVCDGVVFTTDCEALGFSGGQLLCASDCMSYSASRCEGATEDSTSPTDPGQGTVDDGSTGADSSDDDTPAGGTPSDDADTPSDTPTDTPDDSPSDTGTDSPSEPGDDTTPDDTTPDDTTPDDTTPGGSDDVPGDDTPVDPGTSTDLFLEAGTACSCDTDCGGSAVHPGACIYGVCMLGASSTCTSAGSQAECPAGFRCWNVSAVSESVCWPDCASHSCEGLCDADDSCVAAADMNCDASCSVACDADVTPVDDVVVPDDDPLGGDDAGSTDVPGEDTVPTTVPARDGTVGAPCDGDEDCVDPLSCETSLFPGGYCTVRDCTATPCPEGTGCYETEGGEPPMCLSACETDSDCRLGYNCWQPGVCYPNGEGGSGDYRCTAESCAEGEICTSSGLCAAVAPGVPTGTVPNCEGVGPAWDSCNPNGGSNDCGELLAFTPKRGSGYWDYPINGETESNQYRSYARRDLMLLIQYAAAQTDCLAQGWDFGNGEPLGLGDMSEANGAIPGTAEGDPGHPEGTHVDGHDMDIAYFQVGTADNLLRPICDHISSGQDQYHCVGEPELLDVWRTALYLGKLHDNPFVRVIGVDGQAGPLIEDAMEQLCYAGWLTGNVCEPNGSLLTYETVDEGMGWYYFHHHHFHISLTAPGSNAWSIAPHLRSRCLSPDCSSQGIHRQRHLMGPIPRVMKER